LRAIWSLPQKMASTASIIVYVALQRYYVRGLVSGALKG
jgi:ABC-type glycerol-3-phosphate transport system permease component